MRRYLNESEAIDFIRPLRKGKVVSCDIDVDNASGEIEILWERGRNACINLCVSFIGGDVEYCQINVTNINEIYCFARERDIWESFFEYMSQDGDKLGTDVWDALEDLGYIK